LGDGCFFKSDFGAIEVRADDEYKENLELVTAIETEIETEIQTARY
jgi:hypothetical protein